MAIRVVVVDDQEVIRKGLASALSGEDIEIVGEAATGAAAVARVKKLKPDVVLMDVLMPELDGLDAFERIRNGATSPRVIMMSAHDNPSYIARAAALGASDFLLKDTPAKAFAAAVRRAARNEDPPANAAITQIKAKLQARRDPKADEVPLTRREYQVLVHLAYGLSNREIGYSLQISVETVKEHVQNILRKFDMPDRTAAAVWLMKRGLI